MVVSIVASRFIISVAVLAVVVVCASRSKTVRTRSFFRNVDEHDFWFIILCVSFIAVLGVIVFVFVDWIVFVFRCEVDGESNRKML